MAKIAIVGICGKMGRRILNLAKEVSLEVVLGLESKDHPLAENTIEGVKVVSDYSKISQADCLIDFSSIQATSECLNNALKYNKPVVIGTTGIDIAGQKRIKEASGKIAIVYSPNMSVGVNLLFKLIKEASRILKGYEVNIEEAHHIQKKDSPSGTAKKLAEIINSAGFNIKIQDIKSVRKGDIIGDHKVIFESDTDKIELIHQAKTRDIFAKGAVLAAKWVVGKPAGLYSMEDVLFKD